VYFVCPTEIAQPPFAWKYYNLRPLRLLLVHLIILTSNSIISRRCGYLAESQKTESPIFLVAEKHVLNVMIRDNNKKKPTCPAPQLHLVSPCLVPASCSRDVSVALVTHLELLSSKRGAQQAQGLKPRSRCAPLAAIPSPYGQESESDGGWRSDDCVQVDGVVARDDVMDSIGRGMP